MTNDENDITTSVDAEPGFPPPAPVRSRRLRLVAGATIAATGLALGGWGMVAAAASSPATAGFPSVQSLSADRTINASSVAAGVDRFVVDITAYDGESGEQDAGTGMVVTADGDVLTNNHVVAGATKLSVKVVSTGHTYTAKVLGTDAAEDVALIQLQGASGLTTLTAADTSAVTTGVAVAAIGNAMNKPGKPSVASGTITATGQSITASDEAGGSSERLTDLLETDADVIAGDSGGPLVDSGGQVIGMDTAGSSSSGDESRFGESTSSESSAGFAIPITKALNIAKKIASGDGSATIVIGTPGLLGVEVASVAAGSFAGGGFSGFGGAGGFGDSAAGSTGSSSTAGATVADVVSGSAAAAVGLTAGDVITAVNGHTISSAAGLSSVLDTTHSGDRASITWTDAAGTLHTASATLGSGPAA
jgi:S1-C subfamily serine protease